VNTMCEGVAPLVEGITGGKVFLRILSNLTDRALVWAKAVIPVELLAGKGDQGNLVGTIEMPMKVGTVGGNLQSNATVALNLRLLNVASARELAEIMGAVGLAQNFSALRALVTDGIQQGHMTLHARSVAVSAGASPEIFETVVERLLDSGEIKVWKAKEIIAEVRTQVQPEAKTVAHGFEPVEEAEYATGYGKAILL